jgi:dTDP-4-amino-4,6-dideoxygalactose transaminase
MWVRKEIEISGGELLRGLMDCLIPSDRAWQLRRIDRTFAAGQTLVCLSVRSGFDLLLKVMNWPSGSEVLMSGLTIPDMPRIVRQHRLRPVGIDLDWDTFGPNLESIRASITPRTKAIVVAHLFGGRVAMKEIVELARAFDLMVIEDCAQAYVGNHYRGHPTADVSMFSFGPIKTNTALGGAVLVVRDEPLRRRLSEAHAQWPINSRWSFAKRIIKYASVRLISTRWIAGAIARAARWWGTDHDVLATKMARGFPGPRFFEKIRRQPSNPLVRLLAKKLESFDPQFIDRRTRRGKQVTDQLAPRVDVLGSQMLEPTFWVYPILVDQRDLLVRKLWQLGFDATTRSSLVPVNRVLDDSGATAPETAESAAELPVAHFLLRNLVFLPFELSIPASSINRMIQAILESDPTRPTRPPVDSRAREPAIAGANDST